MSKADMLIRTKLRLPTIRVEQVTRPRLQEQMARGLRGPLTLVTAPAGFGKTTLVASCAASCGLLRERPVRVAWLSLDKNDNQIWRFLSYLVAALQLADPEIGSEAAKVLAAQQQAQPEAILTSLINNIDRARVEISLVLDDYHLISDPAVHEALAFLLEHCPETFHLVIATRSDPQLPLARLRASGRIVELRAADLRFTQAEAAEFLNGVMDLSLDAESISTLEERTEGWIAGLQMASIALQSRLALQGKLAQQDNRAARTQADMHRFIDAFSGTNRFILDYLIEEVLAGQTPEIQRFLLYTSILERLSAPLCDALLIEGDESTPRASSLTAQPSSSILEYLERANLFLVPLDDERVWYRYHHLFAELLRARLEHTLNAGDITKLHARAAGWYEQNGLTYEAIYHASLTSNEEWVEHLIEENYIEVFRRRETASIRFLTGRLSKELVYRRPWLCIYKAESHAWFGELDEAETLLSVAEDHIHSRAPSAESRAMLGYLSYVKGRITAMRGDLQKAIALGYTARDNTPAENQAVLGPIGAFIGYAHFLDGNFARSIQVFDETIRAGVTAGVVSSTMGAYCALARVYAVQGQLHKSYAVYEEALKFFQASGSEAIGAVGIVQAGMASLLYEWNDLEAAHQRIRQGIELLPHWNKADDTVLAWITLARIQQAQGNALAGTSAAQMPLTASAALESIERAAQAVRASGTFSETRNAFVSADIRLKMALGNLAAAAQWASSVEKSLLSEEPFRFENERPRITLSRVYLAQEKWEEAIGLLSRLEAGARSAGRLGSLIEILMLKALAAQGCGDRDLAPASITQSLTLAESEGYVRIFADEGRTIRQLLASWLARAGGGSLRAYGARLLACMDAALPGTESTRVEIASTGSLIEPLSRRELEVLQLMAEGRTNPEIARQLVVAPGTIKAHAASIYRKLDAANRTEAVTHARQLGLLP